MTSLFSFSMFQCKTLQGLHAWSRHYWRSYDRFILLSFFTNITLSLVPFFLPVCCLNLIFLLLILLNPNYISMLFIRTTKNDTRLERKAQSPSFFFLFWFKIILHFLHSPDFLQLPKSHKWWKIFCRMVNVS